MGSMCWQTWSKARLKVSRRRASVSLKAEVAAARTACAPRSSPPASSSLRLIASYCSTACVTGPDGCLMLRLHDGNATCRGARNAYTMVVHLVRCKERTVRCKVRKQVMQDEAALTAGVHE